MKYEGIEHKEAKIVANFGIKRRNLHIFSCILLCFVMISVLGANMWASLGIDASLKRITSRWAPKDEDFGKIKFVNFLFEDKSKDDGIFIVKSPFKNYYANNISKTCLQVFGLGDPIVYSSIDGVIKNITFDGKKYSLQIENNKVVVDLSDLDFVCVASGNNVRSGDKIAISNDSKIHFSLSVDGENLELPASGVNTTFFE